MLKKYPSLMLYPSAMMLLLGVFFHHVFFVWDPTEKLSNRLLRLILTGMFFVFSWLFFVASLKFPEKPWPKALVQMVYHVAFMFIFGTWALHTWLGEGEIQVVVILLLTLLALMAMAVHVWFLYRQDRQGGRVLSVATLAEWSMLTGRMG